MTPQSEPRQDGFVDLPPVISMPRVDMGSFHRLVDRLGVSPVADGEARFLVVADLERGVKWDVFDVANALIERLEGSSVDA